ncbi:unnamed protein product [Rhizophagus irregularis]|nr:unnamed protein product [Rhizophagus irregularis]
MSHQVYPLWILLEGHPRSILLDDIIFNLKRDANLSDLAPKLVNRFSELAQKNDLDLEFFNFDARTESLPLDTTLKAVEQDTSAVKPLVVRYPLTDNTIVVKVRLLSTPAEICLPHTTGVWYMLLIKTKQKYKRLQEDGNAVYFVDQETKKKTIDEEFIFNDLMKKTNPNCDREIVISLLIRIKGKKPYAEWTPKDVLNEILHDQYSAIEAIPELDIDATFGTDPVLDGQELRRFNDNLERIASAFHYEVSSNEATARNYINPFMVDAVAKVRSKYPSTRLVVEEDFDGSRGYGRLDYVIYCRDLAILISEAKMIEIQKQIAQILVQLHTAAEKRKRKLDKSITNPPIICGIVSTGIGWRFILWSGLPENPTIKISKLYVCAFGGDMRQAKEVISIIVRILQSQASVLAPQDEVKDEVKAEGIDQDNDDEE